MAKKKIWRAWTLRLPNIRPYQIERAVDGYIHITDEIESTITLTPTEARRLFQKLSGDYRD